MSAEAEGTGMSKSARKRANKKARDAAAEEEEPAPAPEPTPAAKPKAKAAAKESASEPKGKAAAKAKADPQSAEPKAKAKAKADPAAAAAAPKAQPKAEAAQAKPAAKGKAKSKAAAAAKPAVEEAPKDTTTVPYEVDDGTGGDWEVSMGVSKKMQKAKERREAKKAEEEEKERQEKLAKEQKEREEAKAKAAAANPKAKAKGKKEAPAAEPKKEEAAAPVVAAATVSAAAVAAKEEPKEEAPKEILHTVTIKVPDNKVGRIIGPKGSTMAMIKEKTGIKALEMDGENCVISGTEKEQVEMAEVAVNEIIQKGYMSLAYDDFAEAQVACPQIKIPNIIGKGGDIIKIIKEQLAVEIDMPKTDPADKSNPGKKVKISLAGTNEAVEKAKECINSIILYDHHEVTHPGVEHAEMEVDPWKYSFIIGKSGSEMRHIQNNFKVKVNIPREGVSTTDKVLIVGEPKDIASATKYIEKVLEKADEVQKGRDRPEKAEDTWNEDGPQEAWMDAYMYKRK